MTHNIKAATGSGIPFGVVKTGQEIQFSISAGACQPLYLNVTFADGETHRIDMKAHHVAGDVYSVRLGKMPSGYLQYSYDDGRRAVKDDYAGYIADAKSWGVPSKRVSYGFFIEIFNWKDDKPPHIAMHELVMYKLHVRGFTMDNSSGVRHKGTFKGVTEKIRYLKELGINCVELMPATDFCEMVPKRIHGGYESAAFLTDVPDVSKTSDAETELKSQDKYKMNYWGYGDSYFFAPKASYAAGQNSQKEFKEMVLALHQAGIEVVMEMNFPEDISPVLILDCLRHWVLWYHVDGFHLNSNGTPLTMLAQDALLQQTKLLSEYFDTGAIYRGHVAEYKHLACLHDAYEMCARRFLKGDDDMVAAFWHSVLQNEPSVSYVRYLASHNGMRLMDMVSFDRKHNEDNGEHNNDGTDYNYSWNCGAEGDTKKRRVQQLRRSQIYNAVIMALLHQGIPMIFAGDEFGQSQQGNNNPYCQDNEISWVNWKNKRKNKAMYEFVRKIIALRQAHPVLHMEKPVRMMDYLGCGYPDVSVHGARPWQPEDTPESHYVGMMYCGTYVHTSGKDDDFFYIAYNMHWEPKTIGLPHLSEKLQWEAVVATTSMDNLDFEDMYQVKIPPRTIVIFKSRKVAVKQKGL